MTAEPNDVEVREAVAALKHDLGKYVAWRSTNLDFEQDFGGETSLGVERVEALQADVLRTRSTREGAILTAWEVWDSARASLPETLEPELEAVGAAVDQLRGLANALRRGDESELTPLVPIIRRAQTEIRTQLRDLHRRLARER